VCVSQHSVTLSLQEMFKPTLARLARIYQHLFLLPDGYHV
jgi:hypothetical protein